MFLLKLFFIGKSSFEQSRSHRRVDSRRKIFLLQNVQTFHWKAEMPLTNGQMLCHGLTQCYTQGILPESPGGDTPMCLALPCCFVFTVSSLKPPCVTSLMRIHNQHRVEDRHMRHPELHSHNVAYPFHSIFHLLGNVAEVLAFSQKQRFSQEEKSDEELKKPHQVTKTPPKHHFPLFIFRRIKCGFSARNNCTLALGL